ncbi:hypothetical protein, variant [Aphanomyces invadans]|uniref:EF-hand domain-containing protein n=1 Tax=Aphanomyces invadans TaxID=157072 RepID=A0A024UUR8_9STRA|nr:hypothetical protein, variant [Aphanomyces invadans]ETW09383.1 hypothetical protein, variant [Aphanomyces invadans]|eukprot:XP_008863188.1 hypothetical protein, variant [Aphanomyces invadans]
MDVMMRLKGGQAFKAISDAFQAREQSLGQEGLPLTDFVEIILNSLPKVQSSKEAFDTISGLIDLFNDIDINGDGTLELSEFTSYCVDAGMVATRVKAAPLKYQYVKNKDFVDRTTDGSGIEKIKWCPELKRAVVVETKANSVKIYTHEFKLVNHVFATSLNVPCDQVGVAGDEAHFSRQSFTSDVDLLVQDAEFIPPYKLLVVSTSNLSLTFYDTDHYSCAMETQTSVTQTMLRWCDGANVLATTGNNHVVSLWRVTAEIVSLVHQILDHHDIVMDVLPIPQYDVLVTCDIKRFIYMWDIQDFRSRGHLVGHTHGVRQMVFSTTNDMLLTAGFEFDAYGWDVSSKQIVMTLAGHRAPLVGIQLARFHTERAVTADVEGNFKVWNIHRLNGASAQLLENVSNFPRFCPRAFATLTPWRDIAAGSTVLHVFDSVKMQKHDEIPLRAFFLQASNLFLGVTETCVNLWDGGTGALLEEFTGLTKSQFLLCCQDSLHRKLIVATDDGEVEVYNCTNLARVRKSRGSIGRIATIQYDSANKLIIACTFSTPPGAHDAFGSGGIYVFDDSTIGECELVRSLTNVNVESASFSYHASLIATAASDAVIQLWDFETLQLQSVCSHPGSFMHVVQFLDPYPVVVAADTNGNVLFFATTAQSPHLDGGILHGFTNAHVASTSGDFHEHFSVVTTINCHLDEDSGVHMLVTGDERGVISIWNLNPMLARLNLTPIPHDKLKSLRRGYHARSKFHRVFGADHVVSCARRSSAASDGSATTRRTSLRQFLSSRQSQTGSTRQIPTPRQPGDVHRMYSWVAHTDAIHSIQLCEHPNLILSSSFDAVVCVWDWKGNNLGSLTNFDTSPMAHPWKFVNENTKRERERREVVEELMKKMDQSPEERKVADMQRRISTRAAGNVNPILKGLFDASHRTPQTPLQKAKNRRRIDLAAAHENGRNLSLVQVGPLIARRSSSRGANDEPSCDSDTFELDKKEMAELNVPTALSSRLEMLQNHENLANTTKHMYVNFADIADDRNKKTSLARCGKLREVDLNPSPFLRDKLGATDVVTMSHSVFVPRPNTAPALLKSTSLPPCASSPAHGKVQQSVARAKTDQCTRRTSSRNSMSALHFDDYKALGNPHSTSTGKLKKINEIILCATTSIELRSASANPSDTNNAPLCNQEHADLRQRMLHTKSKHDRLVADPEPRKLVRTNLRAAQQKLEKEKRAKRYLAQKKRQTTAKIGTVLRHTSIMMTSHGPGVHEIAKADGTHHRFGIYSIKEVMVIIRLFWSLDIDCSGTVCESELMGCQQYFEKLGYTDMATIFRSIDSDGSGEVNLAELLKICFMYASAADIKDMLTLEKLGRAPSMLATNAPLTPEQLADMQEIFHVFDRDRSGTISLDEVLDALHCKQDSVYDAPALSVDEVRQMYQAEDRNGNKELDFDEFVSLMQGLYSQSGMATT